MFCFSNVHYFYPIFQLHRLLLFIRRLSELFIKVFLLPLVPEYEISEPYQTNADGEFVSHTLHERHTRDVHDKGAWYYKMDAFAKKMHLKLTRNTQLIKPGLELETRHKNGDVTWTPVKSDSYFHDRDE